MFTGDHGSLGQQVNRRRDACTKGRVKGEGEQALEVRLRVGSA